MNRIATAFPQMEVIKRIRGWAIVLGAGLIVLGVATIGSPLMAGIAIEFIVGLVVLLRGIALVVHALKAKVWGVGQISYLPGIVSVLAGIVMLAHPLLGMKFLTLLITTFLIVEGGTQVYLSFHRPERRWSWRFFGGSAAVLFGILIWTQWPLSGTWAVGAFVGVHIVLGGLVTLVTGISSAHHASRITNQSERIEVTSETSTDER